MRLEDNSISARSAKNTKQENRDPKYTAEPVAVGLKKNKPFSVKIIDALFSQKFDQALDYTKNSIIAPGIKKIIFDAVIGALSMAIFGDTRGTYLGRDIYGGRTGGRGYDTVYDASRRFDNRQRRRSSTDVSDIYFEYREDAERVLDRLNADIEKYGTVRVADLYSAAGVTGNSIWTDNNFGWFNLKGVRPYPSPDGWYLDLPPAESLR